MKLYSYYRSSCSYRVRIALEHKEIPYEYVPVHLLNNGGEQLAEDYSQINPKQEVPTLVDEGLHLSQSTAIFFYLDRIKLGRPLFPKEMPQFERCVELVEIINSGIQPLQNLAILKKLKKDFALSDEQKNKWIKDLISKGLQAYNKKLDASPRFSLGDEPSAADMFLIPQIYNAKRFGVDFSQMPHLLEVEKNCLDLESFQKAHPDQQPDSPKEATS